MYLVMMNALTLGYLDYDADGIQETTMHGYPGRSHIKFFAVSKNFFPCWRGCRIIILHISGLRHSLESWGPWSTT